MTSVFWARRRAEELDAVADGRLPADAVDAEVRELAGVVSALRSHEPVTLRPAFAADLRERLMAEAATALTPSHASLVLPPRTRGKRERRLVAAASAVVLIGGTASMAAAAQSSLPGEALYPIKRGIERAQTSLTSSPAGKGRDLLQQANDRLDEAQGLLAGGPSAASPQVPATIGDFTAQAQQGADLLMTSFEDTRDPATIVAVRTFAAHGLTALQAMARTAPAGTQDDLAAAATALSDIDSRARDLCAGCAPDLPDLAVPPMFLAAAEVDRALRAVHVDKLDNSHPIAVPRDAVKSQAPAKGTKAGVPSTPLVPQPSPSPDSSGPSSLLPKLPGADEQAKKGAVDLNKTVTGLTDGLSDMVTLLPDPTAP